MNQDDLELKPNYFAIIPANVRYDNDISPNAKLLYGEITSLCNKYGYCWASNNYFANLYKLSDRSIRLLIKQLKDKKYIDIEIIDKQSRKIYIDITRYEKNFLGVGKNFPTTPEKNFTHNNKYNNKINNIKEIKENIKENYFDVSKYAWFE